MVRARPLLALGLSLWSSSAFLTPRVFDDWAAYYLWRDGQTGRQDVIPCVAETTPTRREQIRVGVTVARLCRPGVRQEPCGYKCLPSLIAIGAQKAGTTGLRYKLLASRQFSGYEDREDLFWDRMHATTTPREDVAANLAWYVPAARKGVVVFQENPRYIYDLDAAKHRYMRSIVPDATMVFLARPGADNMFSQLEMWADHDGCHHLDSFGTTCPEATEHATRNARHIFHKGRVEATKLEQRWQDVTRTYRSSPYFFPKPIVHHPGAYQAVGGFFYSLHYLWRSWPREQTLVLESAAVWARPRESYDALARALRLNFTIRLVPNTRTRPDLQDDPKCPSRVKEFKRLVSTCDLKMPYRCAWHSANVRLAELLDRYWPLRWNEGVNASVCARYGFSQADLDARF